MSAPRQPSPAAAVLADSHTPRRADLTIMDADTHCVEPDDWTHLKQSSQSWYGTPGHALLYAHVRPQWVALWRDERSACVAGCYGFSRQYRGGRHLSLGGPTGASDQMLRELIALHRQRMGATGKTFLWTPDKLARRARLARESGLLCGRWVAGRLVGGTLNYLHGSDAYLSTVAHDPRYDHLHGGLVCLLDTVRHLTERGLRRYNLHVRYAPFKARLGGVEHQLHHAVLFANAWVAAAWHARLLAARRRARADAPDGS